MRVHNSKRIEEINDMWFGILVLDCVSCLAFLRMIITTYDSIFREIALSANTICVIGHPLSHQNITLVPKERSLSNSFGHLLQYIIVGRPISSALKS